MYSQNIQDRFCWRSTCLSSILIVCILFSSSSVVAAPSAATISSATSVNVYTYLTQNEGRDNMITVASGAAFKNGDKILIIQMNNGGGACAAGVYEYAYIQSGGGTNTFTLSTPLKNTYCRVPSEFTATAQVVKVAEYTDLTITGAGRIVPANWWNGLTGGIIAIDVYGKLQLDGVIDASASGFRGADGGLGFSVCWDCPTTSPGESYDGYWHYPSPYAYSGGGGSGIISYYGYGGGGGGAYGTAGGNGQGIDGHDGWVFGRVSLPGSQGMGYGGAPYGSSNLEADIFMGSGGGYGNYAPGANGGGIIIINAAQAAGSGYISSNGEDGVYWSKSSGGAGGGVLFRAGTSTFPASHITVNGGSQGGTACTSWACADSEYCWPYTLTYVGGAGGVGRMQVKAGLTQVAISSVTVAPVSGGSEIEPDEVAQCSAALAAGSSASIGYSFYRIKVDGTRVSETSDSNGRFDCNGKCLPGEKVGCIAFASPASSEVLGNTKESAPMNVVDSCVRRFLYSSRTSGGKTHQLVCVRDNLDSASVKFIKRECLGNEDPIGTKDLSQMGESYLAGAAYRVMLQVSDAPTPKTPADKIVNAKAGAITVDLRPGWDGRDGLDYRLFNYAKDDNNQIILQKTKDSKMRCEYKVAGSPIAAEVPLDIQSWVAGTRHRVLMQWDAVSQFLRCKVDDNPVVEVALPSSIDVSAPPPVAPLPDIVSSCVASCPGPAYYVMAGSSECEDIHGPECAWGSCPSGATGVGSPPASSVQIGLYCDNHDASLYYSVEQPCSYSCPAGNYPCSGSPPTCTSPAPPPAPLSSAQLAGDFVVGGSINSGIPSKATMNLTVWMSPATDVVYCAQDATWAKSLDAKGKPSCEYSKLKWTGTACCGEPADKPEFYSDPIGAAPPSTIGTCWNSSYLPSGLVAPGTSEKVISIAGSLLGCGLAQADPLSLMRDAHVSRSLIQPATVCTLAHDIGGNPSMNLFCSPKLSRWKDTSSNKDLALSSNPSNPDDKDCCARGLDCWDGRLCVADQSNDPTMTLTAGYRCVKGEWRPGNPQFTPDRSGKGFCPRKEDCLWNPRGSSVSNYMPEAYLTAQGEVANQPACLADGQFIGDPLCVEGNWSTRAKAIALEMIDIAEALSPNDYALFCGDYKDVLNFIDYDPETLGMGSVKSYIETGCSRGGLSIPCVNNFCSIRLGDGRIGFGTSLNMPIDDPQSSFLKALGMDATGCNAAAIDDGGFHDCVTEAWYARIWSSILNAVAGQSSNKNTLMYNHGLQAVISKPVVPSTPTGGAAQVVPATRKPVLKRSREPSINLPMGSIRTFVNTDLRKPFRDPMANVSAFDQLFILKSANRNYFAFLSTDVFFDEFVDVAAVAYDGITVSDPSTGKAACDFLSARLDPARNLKRYDCAYDPQSGMLRMVAISKTPASGAQATPLRDFWRDMTAKLR